MGGDKKKRLKVQEFQDLKPSIRTNSRYRMTPEKLTFTPLSRRQIEADFSGGYASFCNWRKRLPDPSADDSAGSINA
jgi:hypothetical protein